MAREDFPWIFGGSSGGGGDRETNILRKDFGPYKIYINLYLRGAMLNNHGFKDPVPCCFAKVYIYIYMGPALGPGARPPPPNGMGPKPTFWLHFHGTRQNTWYLQCFDELGLQNRGICSVL